MKKRLKNIEFQSFHQTSIKLRRIIFFYQTNNELKSFSKFKVITLLLKFDEILRRIKIEVSFLLVKKNLKNFVYKLGIFEKVLEKRRVRIKINITYHDINFFLSISFLENSLPKADTKTTRPSPNMCH